LLRAPFETLHGAFCKPGCGRQVPCREGSGRGHIFYSKLSLFIGALNQCRSLPLISSSKGGTGSISAARHYNPRTLRVAWSRLIDLPFVAIATLLSPALGPENALQATLSDLAAIDAGRI